MSNKDVLEEPTILYSNYFTADKISAYRAIFDADPNLWYITAWTKDGKELTIFRGLHP